MFNYVDYTFTLTLNSTCSSVYSEQTSLIIFLQQIGDCVTREVSLVANCWYSDSHTGYWILWRIYIYNYNVTLTFTLRSFNFNLDFY